MADFTQSYVGGPSGTPIQPISPVEDNTTTSVIGGITSLFDIADKAVSNVRKAESEAAAGEMITAFSKEQMKLAQAVHLGTMPSREARTRMRKNYYAWISNNPSYQEDITKAHTSIVDKSGLGKIIMEGTKAEQTREDFWKKALGEGWGSIHDTDEQKEAAVSNYIKYQEGKRLADLAKTEQERLQRELTMQGTRTKNQKASLELRMAEAAEKSKQALGTLSDAYLPKFRNQVDAIANDLSAGVIDEKTAMLQLQSTYTDIESTLRAVGSRSGTDYVNNLVNAFQDTFEAGQDRISGKLDNDLYKNKVDNIILRNKANILADDKTASLAAKVDLFRITELSQTPEILDAIRADPVGIENTTTQPNSPPNLGVKGSRDANLTFLKSGVNTVLNNPTSATPKSKEELNTGINNILEGVDVHERYLKNPKDMQSVVDFFADRNVGKYISENIQRMTPEAASNARTVIQKNYNDVVLPMVKESYDGYAQYIQPVFTSGGIVFQYKDNADDKISDSAAKYAKKFNAQRTGGISVAAREAVAEANKKLAPLINKMVMSSAHLSGNTNYKQEYETLYAPILFGVDEEEGTGKP